MVAHDVFVHWWGWLLAVWVGGLVFFSVILIIVIRVQAVGNWYRNRGGARIIDLRDEAICAQAGEPGQRADGPAGDHGRSSR